MHFVLSEQILPFEKWLSHFYAEGFCFVGTGYGTAVVIGKNDDRFAPEFRVENALAGRKKIVAIEEGKKIFNRELGEIFDCTVALF